MATASFRYQIRILNTLLSRPVRPEAGIWTVLTTLALFAGCALYWSRWLNADKWMPASRRLVFDDGHLWTLFTTLFAHADLGHLLANTFMYVILGYLLTGYFGALVYPLLAWALAIPMTALALLTYPSDTQLIGASGLVHLMGGLWLSLFFFLSRNLRLTQRILRAGGVMLALFFPTSFEPNVSYRVHFIGLLIGMIAGCLYFALKRDELRAQEELDIEYEPDPALVAAMQKNEPATSDPHWQGFHEWDDIGELDGVDRLLEDLDDDEGFDAEDEDSGDDDDPPGKRKPRRLGPRKGHA